MRSCPEDRGVVFGPDDYLSVSMDEVIRTIVMSPALDTSDLTVSETDRIRFIKGWFKDSLRTAQVKREIKSLAVLRLDGDLYESTIDCLNALYHKITPGGFLIVDDYALPTCRKAVDDFRAQRGITEKIEQIDWTGIYWRKKAAEVGV